MKVFDIDNEQATYERLSRKEISNIQDLYRSMRRKTHSFNDPAVDHYNEDYISVMISKLKHDLFNAELNNYPLTKQIIEGLIIYLQRDLLREYMLT